MPSEIEREIHLPPRVSFFSLRGDIIILYNFHLHHLKTITSASNRARARTHVYNGPIVNDDDLSRLPHEVCLLHFQKCCLFYDLCYVAVCGSRNELIDECIAACGSRNVIVVRSMLMHLFVVLAYGDNDSNTEDR